MVTYILYIIQHFQAPCIIYHHHHHQHPLLDEYLAILKNVLKTVDNKKNPACLIHNIYSREV